ncbi:hypothetical protein GWI33_009936 [Rhynchophorus ferrugineus]|uniref:Uncharacterized protein n=1 Tax=Rhynchophorus ferrugineus TaxID=354439 RepID=A0A834M9E9_RHYFE|nr:hypothetical protein GWI33_009936 [Rhynchophorus ferrugineus]
MDNTEQRSEQVVETDKKDKFSFIKSNYPLIMAAILLAGGGLAIGYNVGHKQGLTVVGFDADAQELSEVVQKQKRSLDVVSSALNTALQERDVAISNSKELNDALNLSKQDKAQAEALSAVYREKLRERGGLSLTIQNLAIKPLPANAYEYILDLVQVSPNNRRAAGRWTMPSGFTPQYIEVHLNGADAVIQRFAWRRGKKDIDVPAFISEIPQAESNAH